MPYNKTEEYPRLWEGVSHIFLKPLSERSHDGRLPDGIQYPIPQYNRLHYKGFMVCFEKGHAKSGKVKEINTRLWPKLTAGS